MTMDPSQLFQIVNVLPLPIWLLWMAAPSSQLSRTVARSVWPWAILAAAYLAFIVVAITHGSGDPEGFFSLAGVMRLDRTA